MPAVFSRTLRSLQADGHRSRTIPILIGAAVLAGWLAWFFLGEVSVFEVTDVARLEVESAAHPVAARLDGQVVATRLAIGKEVKAGDVLVELDATPEQRALEEGKARREALLSRREAVRVEIEEEQAAGSAHQKAADLAVKESEARAAEAEARAEFSQRQLEVVSSLVDGKAASEEALRQGQAEAKANRAAATAQKLATLKLEADRAAAESDRRTRVARLQREAVEIEGQAAVEAAAIRKLDGEIELRRIRAPVDGRVGEASDLRAGSVVLKGERIGAIVPAGEPRAVARFPVSGVGRIRPGQRARLRLEGFPWTQYGTLPASVTDVASEPSGGLIRVELRLEPSPGSAIPLEHGITASAEVEVERLSPVALVLRAAGKMLTPRRLEPSAGGGRDGEIPR